MGWGVGRPVHDHVDGLGVGFVGYDFGVFAEEFEDSVGSRVPWDLHFKMLPNGGKMGSDDRTGLGRYIGHLDDSPVHPFGKLTEILEWNCFPRFLHHDFSQSGGKARSNSGSGEVTLSRVHVTHNLHQRRTMRGKYLCTNNASARPNGIDTTGHTFRTNTESAAIHEMRGGNTYECTEQE